MENKRLKTLKEVREVVKEELKPSIQIVTPQFERLDDLEIEWIPETLNEFKSLFELPVEVLHKMGCRKWEDIIVDETEKWVILYPGEWYEYIPEDLDVVDIFGEEYKFKREKSSNDIRFGCLSFGFLKNK